MAAANNTAIGLASGGVVAGVGTALVAFNQINISELVNLGFLGFAIAAISIAASILYQLVTTRPHPEPAQLRIIAWTIAGYLAATVASVILGLAWSIMAQSRQINVTFSGQPSDFPFEERVRLEKDNERYLIGDLTEISADDSIIIDVIQLDREIQRMTAQIEGLRQALAQMQQERNNALYRNTEYAAALIGEAGQ